MREEVEMLDDEDVKPSQQEAAGTKSNTGGDRYKEVFDETRKNYLSCQLDQSNLRDKYVLTVSAASLAFSVTYIDKVAPVGSATWVPLLVFSWALLAVSIICSVVAFHVNVKSYDDYLDQLEDKYNKGEELCGIKSDRVGIVKFCNSAALFFFVAGLLAFGLFAAINILQRTSA
jgi:hypothetical protein